MIRYPKPNQTNSRIGSAWLSQSARAILLLALAGGSAYAQSVTMRSQPLRFTMPKGVAATNVCTVTVPVSGLVNQGVDTINLSVTGLPGSGNTAAFLNTNGLTSNLTYSVTVTVTNDGTTLPGDYDVALEATGAAGFRLPVPLQIATVWQGAGTAFTTGANWQGGVAPSATDAVIFRDTGGQASTATTNIVVGANTTVASVRFAPEASGTRFHNMEILSGAKLSVTGPGLSFSLHRDGKLVAQRIDTLIAGAGTLEVANPSADLGVLLDGQQNCTLDMRNLDNFSADIRRIGLGDHRMWPNYYTNGYVGSTGAGINNPPTRFVPLVWLARTNVIKCNWVDANNYNDPGVREYAIDIGNDEASGTTTAIRFSLGLSNAFFIDSICWSHSGKGAGANTYNFNAANSYALFRGIGGGRMSVMALGDASGVGVTGSNVRGNTVDFGNGQVDAMVDRLLIARSRTNSSGMTIQGTLTFGGASLGSVIDANTVIVGDQDFNNQGTGAISGPSGTINVNSNATLKVNDTLHLGYTTAPSVGPPSSPENCSGALNINNGGIVMASNILAGGVTKQSVANNISVNNSGKLIVTNLFGAADAPINNLTLANNAEVTLLGVAAGQTAIYTRTFAAATACSIKIPAIAGYVSGKITIPLISYQTPNPIISGLAIVPPAGLFFLSAVDDGAGTINVTFGDRLPQTVVWRGTVSSDWNTTQPNWVTQVGGFQTNYTDGDSVVFDDTVGAGPTTISISSPVAPGQLFTPYGIVVSNATYTFDSGNVIGSSTLLKTGTGNLVVNGNLSTSVLLAQGSFSGANTGNVGPTTIQSGGTMTAFLGTINGGLTAAGGTVDVVGTVNGGLKLQVGTVANHGTISGSFNISTNVTLVNNISANLNVILPWSVPTNSVLVNNGTIKQAGPTGGNLGLTVNGQLKGVGVITQFGTNAAPDVRVTMGPGSTLTIGNAANEITNMTIAVRLDLLADSTTIFDVDNATPLNDKIVLTDVAGVGKVNFGAGNSLGGKIVINKTAGPAFNLLTSLSLFDLNSNIPDNANQAIPAIVPVPAPNLTWDVSQTISNLTVAVMGLPTMTNSTSLGTNGVKNLVFEWPEGYRGWRLERQTNSLAVGLQPSNGSNWLTVATSLGGTNATFLDTNTGGIYFRSVQAVTDTNGVGLNPATFFRLTYP